MFNLFPVEISESLSLCVSISKVITCNWWSFFFLLFYLVGANTHSLTLMSPWTNGNEGMRKKKNAGIMNDRNCEMHIIFFTATGCSTKLSRWLVHRNRKQHKEWFCFILIFATHRGGGYKWAIVVSCKDCTRFHKRIILDRNFLRKKRDMNSCWPSTN